MLSHLALLILIPAAQNMICATILNRIAMTTIVIKMQICLGMVPGTTTYTIRVSSKIATERLRSTYIPTHKLLVSLLEQHRITSNSVVVIFQVAEIQTPRSRNTYLVYHSMSSGAFPETFLKYPKFFATVAIRITYKLSLIL